MFVESILQFCTASCDITAERMLLYLPGFFAGLLALVNCFYFPQGSRPPKFCRRCFASAIGVNSLSFDEECPAGFKLTLTETEPLSDALVIPFLICGSVHVKGQLAKASRLQETMRDGRKNIYKKQAGLCTKNHITRRRRCIYSIPECESLSIFLCFCTCTVVVRRMRKG